jgi:hypothetical protein
MDFFERWFQFSPDGGNGSLEATFLLILAGVFVVIVLSRRIQKSFRNPSKLCREQPSGGVKP